MADSLHQHRVGHYISPRKPQKEAYEKKEGVTGSMHPTPQNSGVESEELVAPEIDRSVPFRELNIPGPIKKEF